MYRPVFSFNEDILRASVCQEVFYLLGCSGVQNRLGASPVAMRVQWEINRCRHNCNSSPLCRRETVGEGASAGSDILMVLFHTREREELPSGDPTRTRGAWGRQDTCTLDQLEGLRGSSTWGCWRGGVREGHAP